MRSRVVRVLPWVLLGTFVVLAVVQALLRPVLDAETLFVVPFGAFAVVGALIARRAPRNPIGWIYSGTAVGAVFGAFSFNYAHRSFVAGPDPLPLATFFAWASSWAFLPGVGALLTFGLLLFPTGRLPSRRWKVVAVGAGVFIPLMTVALALVPGPVEGMSAAEVPAVTNPVGLETAGGLVNQISDLTLALFPIPALLSMGSLVVRFRRGSQDERHQIKWFAFAATLLVLSFPLEPFLDRILASPGDDILFAFLLTLLPTSIGVAILKYRLYDIDVIINRALVYGVLTATLVASYFLIVVALGRVFAPLTNDSDLAIAASTLAVAALFRPLRARVQGFIDRRFYRSKYDSAEALKRFSTRLRDEIEVDVVSSDVLGVVQDTLQPRHASVWLRAGGGP